MAEFNQALEQARGLMAGIEGADMTVYDDLASSYSLLESGAAAKVEALEAELVRLQAENDQLKIHNYDEIMNGRDANKVPVDNEPEPDPEDEEERGIDALFNDSEDDE